MRRGRAIIGSRARRREEGIDVVLFLVRPDFPTSVTDDYVAGERLLAGKTRVADLTDIPRVIIKRRGNKGRIMKRRDGSTDYVLVRRVKGKRLKAAKRTGRVRERDKFICALGRNSLNPFVPPAFPEEIGLTLR